MSAPAPISPDERRRALVEKRKERTGRCVACTCERFELGEHLDGYVTCVCRHTQWGHRRP